MSNRVFEPMNDFTRKAVVVVNFDNTKDEMEVNFGNAKNGKVEVCIPFQKDSVIQMSAKIKVPPRTCAVLVVNDKY